jgi:hypothetical protein
MMAGAVTWSDARIDRLCALARAGRPVNAIAQELGVTRNAVMGRLHRLRAAGDPRAPAAGENPATPRPAPAPRRPSMPYLPLRDRLAEAMAQGCPSLLGAAIRLAIPLDEAEGLWAQIVRGLGPQAR